MCLRERAMVTLSSNSKKSKSSIPSKACVVLFSAGAAIDVYSEEPPEISSPLMLCQSEKIVFTPHIAWASVEARKKCVEMTAENIMAFKKGDSLHDVCNS